MHIPRAHVGFQSLQFLEEYLAEQEQSATLLLGLVLVTVSPQIIPLFAKFFLTLKPLNAQATQQPTRWLERYL